MPRYGIKELESNITRIYGWRAHDAHMMRIPPPYIADHDEWFSGYDAAARAYAKYLESRESEKAQEKILREKRMRFERWRALL